MSANAALPSRGARINKLPKMPLPKFGNEPGQSFRKFMKLFDSTINKHNLDDDEKFAYLKQQLYGGAWNLLDSYDVDIQSYATAKIFLEKAFDSTANAKFDTLSQLSELMERLY